MRNLLTLISAMMICASGAMAQDAAANYPNRPIRIIVCTSAGGGVDTAARIIANGLQQKLGQPVVVENRPGAGGNIGSNAVFNSDPDGYTLLASFQSPLTINPLLYKHLPFDPKLFEPVAIMSVIPNVLLVRPDFPAKTAKELIAYAKAHPGKLNYASQGTGTTSHLTAALLETVTGSQLTQVPYKGTAPALTDIISSHVDMMFVEIGGASKLSAAGRARILAIATEKRIPSLPDVPTLSEVVGRPLVSSTWNAIVAPPKTPAAIVGKLNYAIAQVLKSPEVVARFAELNMQAGNGSPADAAAFIKHETSVWDSVIREAKIETK